MKIDAHCNIGSFHNRYVILVKNAVEIIKLMNKFHIDRACVSSLKATQDNTTAGNLELKHEIAPFLDRFIPFCVINPREKTAIQEMRKHVEDYCWKGVKLHPLNHRYPANCYSARKIVREAADLGVPVLVHSSIDHPNSHPLTVGKLAGAIPEATIIMGYMGGHLGELDALEAAEEFANIILDTTTSSMRHGLIAEAVDRFGAERLVFGTGMPVYYPGPQIVRITCADITDKQKKMILGENIARILNLKNVAKPSR
jgi:predicted TIM-barrel fold metal-dependent hydrolase